MNQFFTFTRRNFQLYLRDKAAVFYSLLSMLIVILLMLFFLGDMSVNSLQDLLMLFPGRDPEQDLNNARLLVFFWTGAGIISVNAMSVTLSAYSVMINDKDSCRISSFYTAPISRTLLACSYVFAAWIASVMVCCATFGIIEIWGCAKGLAPFSLMVHLKLLGLIMINSFTFAALMYLIGALARTPGAWGGIGTVLGTLVGFLGGIYIPLGTLSLPIVRLLKCTPVIYGTSMFRKILLADIMRDTFAGLPSQASLEYSFAMGVDLALEGHTLSIPEELSILLIYGILFLSTGVCILRFGRKTDR